MKNLRILALTAALAAVTLGVVVAENKAAKKAQPREYPLKTCVVSDDKLGSMGDPYVFQHEGRDVKLCCKGCLKTFKKDPAKYVKKLDEAQKPKK